MTILCSDPRAQYLSHQAEIDAAIARVLQGGRYILGEDVAAFEMEFARFIGVDHAIGVGSGTAALALALAACGIGPGDEVITVAHTAVATAAGIERAGATPVFVDIDPEFYTMDPRLAAAAITPRTRAILPVHLYGQAADLTELAALARDHGLKLIEDCAQAHGAVFNGKRIGSFGDAACFSFYPTKNLGALGDGGAVVTSSEQIGAQVRALREYGWDSSRISLRPGDNSRLDELQAAVLRVKLRALDADNARRAAAAAVYRDRLRASPLVLPAIRPGATHVYHLFVVRSPHRDELRARLEARGIQALVHYPVPIHRQPAYERFSTSLPETENAAREILSLPIYPEISRAALEEVAAAIS